MDSSNSTFLKVLFVPKQEKHNGSPGTLQTYSLKLPALYELVCDALQTQRDHQWRIHSICRIII